MQRAEPCKCFHTCDFLGCNSQSPWSLKSPLQVGLLHSKAIKTHVWATSSSQSLNWLLYFDNWTFGLNITLICRHTGGLHLRLRSGASGARHASVRRRRHTWSWKASEWTRTSWTRWRMMRSQKRVGCSATSAITGYTKSAVFSTKAAIVRRPPTHAQTACSEVPHFSLLAPLCSTSIASDLLAQPSHHDLYISAHMLHQQHTKCSEIWRVLR